MSASTDLPLTALTNFRPANGKGRAKQPSAISQDQSLSAIGSELVFIQNELGEYLSFYWSQAECYGLRPSEIVDHQMSETLSPVAPELYLNRCQQVLEDQRPVRFCYPFRYEEQYLLFDLVVSPILTSQATATTVLVMGRLLSSSTDSQAFGWPEAGSHQAVTFSSSDRYPKLLKEITRKIRRTLDLETIWQQAVIGLGTALGLDRCAICNYKSGSKDEMQVLAEYSQTGVSSLVGSQLLLAQEQGLSQALLTLEPVAIVARSGENGQSMLVAATCYQDQPNGLIILYQGKRKDNWHQQNSRLWTTEEIEFVRELASQVGTAIAHANLFAESQALASELQRVNAEMLEKNRELELANEQAEEACRLKSNFIASTSHELRTPLNGIIGFLKLIQDGMADDPKEEAEFIDEAYRSALHLLDLINDVLDIAKIEAGKMEIDLSPVVLDDLLRDVEKKMKISAEHKKLYLTIEKPRTLDKIIMYGDYKRILQVILNLASNAIKFTKEGGINISTEILSRPVCVGKEECPGMVKVRVADTGIGVSLEKQQQLFQNFYQVDGGRTRTYGGTGLGLAISQRLIEAMGGEINFFSMGEGLGSTITFTVPLYHFPVMVND
ncbi:MAG: sensor histidine kinase [Hormoscilla sp.]